MESVLGNILSLPSSPFRFDYLPAGAVVALFLLLSIPIIYLGRTTICWQGPARGSTTVGVRLASVWIIVLLLAGARWERHDRDLEVMIVRDVSASVANVPHPAEMTLLNAEDDYFHSVTARKPAGDRIGLISFDQHARIDALPDTQLHLGMRGMAADARDAGTDIASAIQLALATFRGDSMRRLVLMTDGNATQGDTNAALDAAAGAGVSVDVMPLRYRIERDVCVDRLLSPSVRRQDQNVTLEAVLRSTNPGPIDGRLMITDRGVPLDLDSSKPGVQSAFGLRVDSGTTRTTIKVPSLPVGMHLFAATFEAGTAGNDRVPINNTAEAITFVRGQPRVLYVENVDGPEAELLPAALRHDGIVIGEGDHIQPERFPTRLMDLQGYDAVVLANVPRGGPEGLDLAQEHTLVHYVRDLGGGLVVIGGPQALGLGKWQESELEGILPVNLQPSPRHRPVPGALVIVLDHSNSMADPMGGASKQQAANSAAIRAVESLAATDDVGVIAFNTAPQWVVPLAANRHPSESTRNIRTIVPAGGTSIAPALQLACDALAKLTPLQSRVRHIVLMTDGVSEPAQYEHLLARMSASRITLSTVAVGLDADRHLLAHLARRGGGLCYGVSDAGHLSDAFVREAQSLRRPLLLEPPGGLAVIGDAGVPALGGIVLTESKPDPRVQVLLRADNAECDPALARWQCGLARTAVFTGDATPRWARAWMRSPKFARFWPQVVRSVARSPASVNFDIRAIQDGPRTRLLVEAIRPDGSSTNFLDFTGKLVGPQMGHVASDVRLSQTGPGSYEATLDTPGAGAYFTTLRVQSPDGDCGTLLAGIVVSSAAEMRELQSNDAMLTQAAARMGGRVLTAFDPSADLFTREGLRPSSSSQPITEVLLCALMGVIILDVAVRRVAGDWQRVKQLFAAAAMQIQNFCTTPSIAPVATVATLRKVHRRVVDKLPEVRSPVFSTPFPQQPEPIAPPRVIVSAPQSNGYAVCLMAAKQRARKQIHEIEQDRCNRR